MKYLFIATHCDDSELSCGGTMAKLIEEGHQVWNVAFSDCGLDKLLEEFTASSKVLGINNIGCLFYKRDFHPDRVADDLYKLRTDFDFVFTHSTDCRHTHHKVVGEQSKRVINTNLITYLQAWNGNESPNYFVELSEQQLEKKIQALSCYQSQSHRAYMNPDFILAQAVYTGIKCGKRYAEGFRIERLIN